MMNENKDEYWSEKVHSDYHPKEGTFTQKHDKVVKILLADADNNPTLALHRLMFYMNRAGKNLSNEGELNLAKNKLENLIKENHQT